MSQAQTGFPCPYREPASHDDGTLLRLVSLATQPSLGHIWQTAFNVAFDDLSPHGRRHRMEMLIAALADERVTHQLRKLRDTVSPTPAKQDPAN